VHPQAARLPDVGTTRCQLWAAPSARSAHTRTLREWWVARRSHGPNSRSYRNLCLRAPRACAPSSGRGRLIDAIWLDGRSKPSLVESEEAAHARLSPPRRCCQPCRPGASRTRDGARPPNLSRCRCSARASRRGRGPATPPARPARGRRAQHSSSAAHGLQPQCDMTFAALARIAYFPHSRGLVLRSPALLSLCSRAWARVEGIDLGEAARSCQEPSTAHRSPIFARMRNAQA
jgi:hypothetical protein